MQSLFIRSNTGPAGDCVSIEKHMNLINYIASLPITDSTLDFALVCAGIITIRIMLSVAFAQLNK
jgi:hypothetical protein